jgi:hypothetical protein
MTSYTRATAKSVGSPTFLTNSGMLLTAAAKLPIGSAKIARDSRQVRAQRR